MSLQFWTAILLLFVFGSYFGYTELGPRPERAPAAVPRGLPQPHLIKGSPALSLCGHFHQTICKATGVTKDPTGTVRPEIEGELEALRIYQEIIRKNPEWTVEELDEELARRIFTPKRVLRIESAFRWTKTTFLKMVMQEKAFRPAEKKLILKKLRNVELQLPLPASLYKDDSNLLTRNDVLYERLEDGRILLRLGGAFVISSKSWFNRVFTFAHELAHAIDPCELTSTHEARPLAYAPLISCFVGQGLILETEISACAFEERLSETFADWYGVRITAEALKSYASEFEPGQITQAAINSVRDLCDQEQSLDDLDLRYHLKPEDRIDKIFGNSPEIRKALRCAPAPKNSYCTFQ